MVRSLAAGLAPGPAPRDYFDSLAELAAYAAEPRPPRSRYSAPLVPLPPLDELDSAVKGSGKLLVCHDYKGGYTERDDERGYTFGFWHLVDTFIYFSHHCVSCPPAGWIRAAHQAGTKMFGTLIFEHDAGRADIVELVAPSGSSPGASDRRPFEHLSTRYADYLVDLTVERGFDGWLVNVEVELGASGGGSDEQKRAHARALCGWLRYFSGEMKRRVRGGEVMWYDAVTTEGKLAWQNAVTDLNLPFLQACDSIFLNYWWRHDQLASTAALLDQVGSTRRSDVYFGLDVFGRGSLGGGGFESWRAVHTVQQATPTGSSSFSTALFAPGWTVEAESLAHSLGTADSFARWQADDNYLFASATPTPSVAPEAARHERERREQRGVLRARQLAAETAPSASPLPLALRVPSPPTFDYHGALPPPLGAELGIPHKPLAAFLPEPRPTPAPEARFYTNFSGGSGHTFYVAGRRVLEYGWTDPAFAAPYPALAFHPPGLQGVAVRLVEHDAWEGPRALELRAEGVGAVQGVGTVAGEADARGGPGRVAVPLCATALPRLGLGAEFVVDIVWKELLAGEGSTSSQPDLLPQLQPAMDEAALAEASSAAAEALQNGWHRSRARFSVLVDQPALTWHLSVDVAPGRTFLLGSLGLYPAPTPSDPSFVLAPPHYSAPTSTLLWDLDVDPATLTSSPTLSAVPHPPLMRPLHYHIFHRTPDAETYLGTTIAQEFPLDLAQLGGKGEVAVAAVFVDGTTQASTMNVDALDR